LAVHCAAIDRQQHVDSIQQASLNGPNFLFFKTLVIPHFLPKFRAFGDLTTPSIEYRSKMGERNPSISRCFSLLTIFNFHAAILAQSCYNPPTSAGQNGTLQPSFYTTCNVNQAVSMCCRTQEEGGDPADVCLSSGLCSNTQGNTTTYWRESCTDPTWESPYCVAIACGMVSGCLLPLVIIQDSGTHFCL
jgi:hypothetical protein